MAVDKLDDWFVAAMSIMLSLIAVLGLALLLPWPGDLRKRRGK
jgi:hypothetical protein